nr:hypothetical protein [Planctomycetota bacterium]
PVQMARQQAETKEAARRGKEDARSQREIEKTVERRDAGYQDLDRALAGVKKWDPSKGEYATVKAQGGGSVYGRSGGIRGGSRGGYVERDYGYAYDTQILTDSSRKDWAYRSNKALAYLKDAITAVRSLGGIERKAMKLGLEPIQTQEELESFYKELNEQYEYVNERKNRKER